MASDFDYNERAKVYDAAIKKWGIEAQTWMVIEEMSELQKEICKTKRGKDDIEAMADEIADVIIMLEQLQIIFNVKDKVLKHMDVKVKRLKERIGRD